MLHFSAVLFTASSAHYAGINFKVFSIAEALFQHFSMESLTALGRPETFALFSVRCYFGFRSNNLDIGHRRKPSRRLAGQSWPDIVNMDLFRGVLE